MRHLLVTVVLLVLVGCSGGRPERPVKSAKAMTPRVEEKPKVVKEEKPKETYKLTDEKFLQIREGMFEDDVKIILGPPESDVDFGFARVIDWYEMQGKNLIQFSVFFGKSTGKVTKKFKTVHR